MSLKPHCHNPRPCRRQPPRGDPGRSLLGRFVYFWLPGHVFWLTLCVFPCFFVVFLPDVDFASFFLPFRRSVDLSRHQKNIKIIVLSSIFKGSPNPCKCPSETTLGSHWDRFWHHFGRRWVLWGALGNPLEVPRLPKSLKRL